MRTTPRLAILALALSMTACGDDEAATSNAPSATPAKTPAAAAPGVPAELVGTYSVRLRAADLPADAPPELTDGGPEWTVAISPDGGIDGAPSFQISSAKEEFGQLESSTPLVSGDEVTLKAEECGAGGTIELYDNRYAYALQGSKLTFSVVENQCADKVAETILTSRPLTKQG